MPTTPPSGAKPWPAAPAKASIKRSPVKKVARNYKRGPLATHGLVGVKRPAADKP